MVCPAKIGQDILIYILKILGLVYDVINHIICKLKYLRS